jgi:hypothetical protein
MDPRSRFRLALAALLLHAAAFAQDDTLQVPWRAGMDLRPCAYADFRSFRADRPTCPLECLRDDQGLAIADLRTHLSRLYCTTDSGRVRVDAQRLWGFCQNGVVYVAAGNGFYRIGLMGTLAHMVYEQSYRTWDPYFYGAAPVYTTVMQQQVIDMDSGRALPFTAAGMDAALAADPLLLEEFRSLPKRQRNQEGVLFRFLRLYNERHPLLFPR